MNSWKKRLSLLATMLVLVGAVTGCGAGQSNSGGNITSSAISGASSAASSSQIQMQAKTLIRVGALKGPTGMGLLELMDKNDKKESRNMYDFTLAGAPDEISGAIINGSLDIAAVPSNMASVLYNKTEKKVTLLAVNTLGVLYVVTKGEEIDSIADLKGKTILNSGQGATQEYALNYILRENGIDPAADVDIQYKSEHAELAAIMSREETGIAVLPQPFVTTVISKDDTIKVALDLTEEWDKVSGSSQLAMGCVIVRNEFLEQNVSAVNAFLDEYKASADWVVDNVDAAAALSEKYGIVPEAVAKKAIPQCSIVLLEGLDMKNAIAGFLDVLYTANPQSIGGALPDEDFYYQR